MQRRVVLVSAVAAALASLLPGERAAASVVAADTRQEASGKAYRRAVLHNHAGDKTSLAQAASGQRLVVAVLKGTWCKVCIAQLKRLAGMQAELSKLDTRVVGLTHEGHKKAAGAAKKARLPFPILSDPSREVLQLLQLWFERWGHPLPSLLVFDRCGKLRGIVRGRRPGQRPEGPLLDLLREVAKDDECNVPRA